MGVDIVRTKTSPPSSSRTLLASKSSHVLIHTKPIQGMNELICCIIHARNHVGHEDFHLRDGSHGDRPHNQWPLVSRQIAYKVQILSFVLTANHFHGWVPVPRFGVRHLFPQLLTVVHFKPFCNTYGSCGFLRHRFPGQGVGW